MNALFESYGLSNEDDGRYKFKLITEYLTDHAFPLTQNPRPVITFNRQVAFEREDVDFITIDHPMLSGALELFLSSEKGTCAVCIWKDAGRKDEIVEFIFILECIAPPGLNASRFLPPCPLRVVESARRRLGLLPGAGR